MKAVAARGGSIESLADVDLPRPEPQGRDLLVKVQAVSINPIDAKRRSQAPGDATPRVLGWDAAGTVVATGPSASLFQPGNEVYYAGDVTRSGCNCEYHVVDEFLVGRKPRSLDFAAAAALPLTALTAWESLFERMHIDLDGAQRGATVLIINGAGGVGSIGIQLARSAGLQVIATASRPDTADWCRRMGAHAVVDHRQDLVAQVGRPVQYIANFSGDLDAHWAAMTELVAPHGHLVSIVGNEKCLPMAALRTKSASLSWELVFTRPRFQTPDLIRHHQVLDTVSSAIDAGLLKSTLGDVLGPIDAGHLQAAHRKIESGQAIGKLVLAGW